MMKIILIALFSLSNALAYVPTVESLFRNGDNPEVTANGVSVTFSIKKDEEHSDFYRIFFSKTQDGMKVAQARYKDASYAEDSLSHKYYLPLFTAYTVKPLPEQMDKGLFYNSLFSIVFNNGTYLVNYLKSAGVPLKLNSELINRQKVEYLAAYKKYLIAIAKDRGAKKSEQNPLRPDDLVAREKAERIMSEPLYVDTKQVNLARVDGDLCWLVSTTQFEAVLSYKLRKILRLTIKTEKGDVEITAKDYWLASGTHYLPRFVTIKNVSGDIFNLEFKSLKHYIEKEEDFTKRLSRWDQILKVKDSTESRPSFLF